MNLEKESALLTLIFADDTVQYREKILPTGSIACMAMNIPKEALEKSLPLPGCSVWGKNMLPYLSYKSWPRNWRIGCWLNS